MTISEDQGNAPQHVPQHDEGDPWKHWLRLILYMNLALAAAGAFSAITQMETVWQQISDAKSTGQMWLTPEVLFSLLVWLGIPTMLLVFGIGCLQGKAGARTGLIIACWCELGLRAIQCAWILYSAMPYIFSFYFWSYSSRYIELALHRAAISGIVLLFLTRTPAKSLFVSASAGFDVIQ